MPDEPLVLGIETSCDETGIGIVRGHTLLADAVASSVDEHARFGGVVPEVASRAHLEALVPTMHRALADAGVALSDVDAIAVTAGPGLAGALLVGVAAAKGYALAHRTGKTMVEFEHSGSKIKTDISIGPPATPKRIVVEPKTVRLGVNETKQLKATGYYDDDVKIDLTDFAEWDVEDGIVGSCSSGKAEASMPSPLSGAGARTPSPLPVSSSSACSVAIRFCVS